MADISPFYLKSDDGNVYNEVRDIKGLVNALKDCPISCVIFHLRDGGNDFASWVQDALGNRLIARQLRRITLDPKNPEKTRRELIAVLR